MSDRPRLLVLNPTCLEVLDAHRAYLDATGVSWRGDPAFAALDERRADGLLEGVEAVILPAAVRHLPTAGQMERHLCLRVLSIAASGWDWLDVEAARACGIVVTFAPATEGVEVVADMAMGLMLAVARQIPAYHQRICRGDHARGMGTAVWGRTLGIIGLGRIGKAVARRAAGFDMSVLAAEPSPDEAFVRRHGIRLTDLDTLLRASDFVSLHVRLDGGTRHMIGRRQLALMKPTAFLINTARRELVDHEALVEAVLSGRIAGAGLDDPPPEGDCRLLDLPNVVFAPHHGNRAIEGVHAVFRLAIDNAVAVLGGRRPEYLVDPAMWEARRR